MVKCPQHGKDGWFAASSGPHGPHGKSVGTMVFAVNSRAFDLLGLKGDPTPYPHYDYDKGEGLP